MIKNTALVTLALSLSFGALANTFDFTAKENEPIQATLQETNSVGSFTAEGKSFDTKFVRVLFAAEGSENEGESNSIEQLKFKSIDPQGNEVEVYRFQILTKNTGYDEVQTSQEEDYKLKSVKEGAKLHIEVPILNGKPQLDKAYVGNLAYNFGTRETRNILTAETASDIVLKINKLELPTFTSANKPGDKGLIYNQGAIDLTLTSKAKHIDSDAVSDFNVKIKGPISVTHIRGKERSDNAVNIDAGVVAKNKK